MITNQEQIQKLLNDVNYELDIYSLRNPNCRVVSQPSISNIKDVLSNIQLFLENLLQIEKEDQDGEDDEKD